MYINYRQSSTLFLFVQCWQPISIWDSQLDFDWKLNCSKLSTLFQMFIIKLDVRQGEIIRKITIYATWHMPHDTFFFFVSELIFVSFFAQSQRHLEDVAQFKWMSNFRIYAFFVSICLQRLHAHFETRFVVRMDELLG